MTSRTTVILLLATVAAFGAIFYFQARERVKPVNNEGDERLFDFDIEDVARIELASSKEKAIFEKEKYGWFMRSPIKDRMDAAKALILIRFVHGLAVKERISNDEIEDGSVKLATYGLDKNNRITLRLKDRRGKQIAAVDLGHESPLKSEKYGTSYVRLPNDKDDDDILVVAGHARIEGSFMQLRDLRAFAFNASVVERMLIQRPGGEIELSRQKGTDDKWDLVRPLDARADTSAVRHLLTKLTNVQADAIVEKDPLHFPAEAEADSKSIKVTLWTSASEKGVQLEVSPFMKDGKPRLVARVSDRDFHLFMPDALEDYLESSANNFRDRHLADLPPEEVESITISRADAPEHVVKLVKDGNYWALKNENILEKADTGKVKQFIDELNRTEIVQFASNSASDLAAFGFKFPDLLITISTKAPDPATQVFRFKQDAASRAVYSNIEGTPFINKLGLGFINRVPSRTLNWRSPNVLDFSTADVMEILITPWKKNPMKLNYDVTANEWKARFLPLKEGVPEEDITPLLVQARAGSLSSGLSVLSANRWISESPNALKALETPSHTFAITLQEFPELVESIEPIEPGAAPPPAPEPVLVTRIIEFAPVLSGLEAPEFYVGRSNASPDMFLIKAELYQQLTTPLLDQRKLEDLAIPPAELKPSPSAKPGATAEKKEDEKEKSTTPKVQTANPVVEPLRPDKTLQPK